MSGVGLRDIDTFLLSRGVLRDAQMALQEAGLAQEERFVLLTGRRQKDATALIRSADVPDQVAGAHDRGVSVTVPGSELQRLNVVWAQRGEQLFAQMHSHPTFPYHSDTDDRYPMVTIEGGLSIVVPLFGFCSMTDLRSCAVYRLIGGRWLPVGGRELDRLVRLI